MVKTYSSEAIVLSRKNYSEADRILTIFSKNHGKLSVLAKGVRKTKSKKRSSVEVFTRIKFSAVKTKAMDIITEAQTVNSFQKIRSDLKKVAVGYFFCEVLSRVGQEQEENAGAYDIACDYFDKLERSENLKKLRLDFIKDILVEVGFWPAGKDIIDADKVLERVLERNLNSKDVGRRLLI